MISRYRYTIKGRVQGVGFRPFVYKLANKFNLIGFAQNNNSGVVVEIEGKEDNIKRFDIALKDDLPPLSLIDEINKDTINPHHKGQFEIIRSNNFSTSKIASILPDSAICQSCLIDIQNNIQYEDYFSTNCTDCGVRYSIIQTVPYDRENTSMKDFLLCDSCLKEYNDPSNRRYHAQAISCKECGPQLELIVTNHKIKTSKDSIFENIADLINQGYIGAIKGVGGFHIVCNTKNQNTISMLRKYKNRPRKPFAIMCKDLDMVSNIATINDKQKKLLSSKEAPIVLLQSKGIIETLIAPNIDTIGVMLPYSAFYYILFRHLTKPIVVTSANYGGEPIITSINDIYKIPFIDFIVDYNRDIVNAIDDSVAQIVDNNLQILRFGRGFAPKEIKLPNRLNKKILALGANQKSTIAIGFEDKIILSPYIGDLDNIKTIEFFKQMIQTFQRFYDFSPDLIVCDKHNGYESTKIAKSFDLPVIQIQHHIAHLYSVKAEHNLVGDFVSFIFDGTGLGDDGKLWGGEVFVGDNRKYYFKSIGLIGGEKAIKEPRRVAISVLFQNYSLDEILDMDNAVVNAFEESEIRLLHQLFSKNINIVESSSVGRYFDMVASLANLCQIQTYEAEAGLLTQKLYKEDSNEYFDYEIKDGQIEIKFDYFDIEIVTKFYNTIIQIVLRIAKEVGYGVILSGGVWQNGVLLSKLIEKFKQHNIRYYYNQTIPINDSSISVGQVYKVGG